MIGGVALQGSSTKAQSSGGSGAAAGAARAARAHREHRAALQRPGAAGHGQGEGATATVAGDEKTLEIKGCFNFLTELNGDMICDISEIMRYSVGEYDEKWGG